MDEKRRAQWVEAIAKQERQAKRDVEIAQLDWDAQQAENAKLNQNVAKGILEEQVTPYEHYALLREGMFKGEATPAVMEEANLFLRYWLHPLSLDPIPRLGKALAKHWFWLRDWDQHWNRKLPLTSKRHRANKALREYIEKNDFDHWTALNLICAELHRRRGRFPSILADWAAERHEGKRERLPKERGNKGAPPYENEGRNRVFAMADEWLEHFGMAKAKDRIAAIAEYVKKDEDVVRKGIKWCRDNRQQLAPWPKFPR